MSACTKRMRTWFRPAFCRASARARFIEIDAHHLRRFAECLGIDREAAGVAAQIEHRLAGAETGQRAAIVALIEKEAGLVLAARRHPKADAVLGDDRRRRRFGGPAIERFLLLNVLLGEPVERTPGKMPQQNLLKDRAEAKHAGGEELQHDRRAEAIDDQAAQIVPFGMDQAIGVGDGIESEPAASQVDGPFQPAGEKGLVDRFVGMGGQHAQGDARMTVVETSADPLAVAIDDFHDASRGAGALAGFSTIFWKIQGWLDLRAIFN